MAAHALPNVFCTMGHGCDMVNEDREIVPDGCKYITSEICGMASVDLPKILIAFRDPLLKDALQYPDHPIILSVLNEYFKLPGGSPLRIHNPGDTYTDSSISLWATAGWGYFKSGIYQLGDVPEGEIYNAGTFDVMAKLHPREVNDELRQFIYRGSIWKPTPHGSLEKRYSEIMRERPGIYYHLACRTSCEPNTTNVKRSIELMRQHSANQIRRKGVLQQLGPFGQNIRPSVHTEKRATTQRYVDWLDYVNNEHLRDGWRRRITIALAEIASPSGSATSPSAAFSSSAASNNDDLPNYINVHVTSSAAAQESNSNEETNSDGESNSNEAANRRHERKLKAIFRGKGRRSKRNTYRKKANRKQKQTRKRSAKK